MHLLFIISSLLTVAVAQQPSVSCIYYFFGQTYGCDLVINNPNGFNDFTEIGGIHLEGFSNANVTQLYRYSGASPNVPSIICQTFPNLVQLDLYYLGLTEIGDNAFVGCSLITELFLTSNFINSISAGAFANLPQIEYLNLESNSLRTLPENVFANQQNLVILNINNNFLDELPAALFQPLQSLEFVYLGYGQLTTFNNQWFANNPSLSYLYLASNRIVLSADSFENLEGLTSLNLASNGIDEIPTEALARLTNLENLYIYGNNFVEIPPDSFAGLERLDYLEIGENPIEVIHDGAFRGLIRLVQLSLSACRLRRLNSNSFEGLGNLYYLYMNFNEIEELAHEVFAPLASINSIGLWGNRLKSLNRNTFGSLTTLVTLDLDSNVMNALDRSIIDEAVNLNTLYFNGNLCANRYFGNFLVSRDQFLPVLERCFDNMRFVIDTTTEGGDAYSFFDGPHPGIAFRVNSDNEVQIALTPFNFVWNPIIEVIIGAANNTRSIIRMNEETDVVTVPTPNILVSNQWNDFRVTWSNQVILVYSANNTFPFMAFTMQSIVPVNFYGLRAVETRALWTVQPFDW